MQRKIILSIFIIALSGAILALWKNNASNDAVQSSNAVADPPLPTPARIKSAQPGLPIRAAFYYPWFPEAWEQNGIYPYTNYTPSQGFYDSSGQSLIRQHLMAMQYARIEAGIISWWGQDSRADQRIPAILSATAGSPFRWAIYYEPEGQGNPSTGTLASDLAYLRDRYSDDPSYLRIDDRFVVFVYADPGDDCAMAERWRLANTVGAYVVLKVFPGYEACPNQPDSWHQYGPAEASDSQGHYSYSISPGFWKVGESARLERDLERWQQNISDMVNSGADFQLITTFNEWGEGTAVEMVDEWASASGYGGYLDALRYDGSPAYDAYLPTILKESGNIAPPSADPVIVAAGDIADCDRTSDEITSALLDTISGTVITLGDNAYDSGSAVEFRDCYDPTWGRHKARTRPSVGNHEYKTADAAGYFDYFGAAAGEPTKGYYSYGIGAWHIIAINSNCSEIGGCEAGSAQEQWLRADLQAHPALCTLAYWHHPLFSSGEHSNNPALLPIWQALDEAGVELVLNGHDHHYERFAPQDPSGAADPATGIREFIVGTGGKNLYSLGSLMANSQVFNNDTFGVLKLVLHPTSYDWEFVPQEGSTFADFGSAPCH
ncbi:MAG: metallophosphoesterase [Anaerolineales bacterium]|nr:metallophosphoesterase [Anaerolineales bacterium]